MPASAGLHATIDDDARHDGVPQRLAPPPRDHAYDNRPATALVGATRTDECVSGETEHLVGETAPGEPETP